MKWGFFILIFINIAIVVLDVSHLIYRVPEEFATSIQLTIGMLFTIHWIYALVMFFDSLGKDMKRSDIWLHSPAPMWQLAGVKGVFVVFVISCSLLLCGMVVGGFYYVGGGTVSVVDVIVQFLRVGLAILLNSIYIMSLGYFFWSIYQVFRSRIGWLAAVVIVIVLINIWLYVWWFVWFTKGFQTVKEMGPLHGSHAMMDLLMHNNYIVPGGTILTIGSICLYGVMTAIYFIAGSILFEKKVRF